MQQLYVRIIYGPEGDEEEEEDQAKSDKKLQAFLKEQDEEDRKRYAVQRPRNRHPSRPRRKEGMGRRNGGGAPASMLRRMGRVGIGTIK